MKKRPFINKPTNRPLKGLLFVAGILLLALVQPKNTPWTMSFLTVSDAVSDVLCLLAAAGAIGLALLFPSGRKALRHACGHRARVVRLCIAAVLLFITLLPLTGGEPIGLTLEEPPVFLTSARPLVLSVILSGLAMLMMLPALAPLLEKTGSRIVRFGHTLSPRLFALLLFALFFAVTNAFSWLLFEHLPHVQDSITQIFHGKILAMGRLTVPPHLYNVFFDFGHMINNGLFYSMYPFGHTIWMALGAWIHSPWLINPLLGALTIILFYRLGKAMYDEQTGRTAAVLACVAPFLIFMSSEYMSHVSALFYLALFMLSYVHCMERGGLRWAVLAGAAIGLALNTRLLTALGIGLPFALDALCSLCRAGGFRRNAGRLAVMAGVAFLFGLLMLAFNYATTGDPLVVGYEVVWGTNHHPGFGAGIDRIIHTPRAGLEHLLANLNALNTYLFEWPMPSLLFLFIPFGLGVKNRWDRLLLASFWCLAAVYFFYWFNDWCFGPRFLYEASGAALLLTARGLRLLPELLHRVFGISTPRRRIYATTAGAIGFLILCGWCMNVPERIRLYADDYWCVNRKVLNTAEQKGLTNAVVYVHSYYACAFPQNAPMLDGDVLYVRDLRDKNRLLTTLYPERKHYRADEAEWREIPLQRPGVVMPMERTPFFRAVADRLGWSYHESWLKPWGFIEMTPEHPQADGLTLDGHTHAWNPNPAEQWADAMTQRAETFIQAGDTNAAAQTLDRLTTIWPEYVPGLLLALTTAEQLQNPPRASNLRERIRLFAEPDLRTNVLFRNGIILTGLRVEPEQYLPGGELTVTLFWHVPRKVTMRNWAISLKLKDQAENTMARNDGVLCSDEEQTHQTDQEDYVEIRRMTLPPEMPKDEYTLQITMLDANPPFRPQIIPGRFPGFGKYELTYPLPLRP